MVLSRSMLCTLITASALIMTSGCAKKKSPYVGLEEPNKKVASLNAANGGNGANGSAVREIPPPGDPWKQNGGVPNPEFNSGSTTEVSFAGDLDSMIDDASGGIMQNANTDNIESAVEIADLDMIHFEYDSSEISESWKTVLDEHAKWLNSNPKVHIQIEGHCDERGTEEYNTALSVRRANVIREYLVGQGVAPQRIETIGYGEMRPLSFDQTNEAYSLNRRGMFLVYTPDFSTETASNF